LYSVRVRQITLKPLAKNSSDLVRMQESCRCGQFNKGRSGRTIVFAAA
jgi:hypothetical protein